MSGSCQRLFQECGCVFNASFTCPCESDRGQNHPIDIFYCLKCWEKYFKYISKLGIFAKRQERKRFREAMVEKYENLDGEEFISKRLKTERRLAKKYIDLAKKEISKQRIEMYWADMNRGEDIYRSHELIYVNTLRSDKFQILDENRVKVWPLILGMDSAAKRPSLSEEGPRTAA